VRSIYRKAQNIKNGLIDTLSFVHIRDVWSYTEKLSKNTHLQDRLLWKKFGNAFPPHYTPR